ncbi:protein of unknown function DUF99 [Pyrobaculum islandicum DSM 4184]|uniref:UPF0215 protein Pisl_1187 n=1 Tax=Pyrobaculum islandicum (strain DSM 4184 / JCM 9189 / GEO3) TaxID=384616 RepID=A1RTS3_PYRIL|nr:DUF99 family protein [Pyrobaculum islandicum]ABL88355.1 protein of unknown function DUF99 [Pyrobaculum islandicum DSM 4184]
MSHWTSLVQPRRDTRVLLPRLLQKNFKVVAIAESFSLEDGYSIYAGVLARRDGVVEEVAFDIATLGGTDGTESVSRILKAVLRPDVGLVMLDGCVVSFYNWIDGEELWKRFRKPVACYVFEEPEGRVEEAVRKLFTDWEKRVEAYRRLGPPVPYYMRSGYKIYVRAWGIDPIDAGRAAELCTKFGKMPEPLRIAKIVASGARQFLKTIRMKI